MLTLSATSAEWHIPPTPSELPVVLSAAVAGRLSVASERNARHLDEEVATLEAQKNIKSGEATQTKKRRELFEAQDRVDCQAAS